MTFINDDLAKSEEMRFAVNALASNLLTDSEKEKITVAAEKLIDIFVDDIGGKFGGIYVFQSYKTEIDAFVFQDGDKWYLILSSEAIRADDASLKIIVADTLICALEYEREAPGTVDLEALAR